MRGSVHGGEDESVHERVDDVEIESVDWCGMRGGNCKYNCTRQHAQLKFESI